MDDRIGLFSPRRRGEEETRRRLPVLADLIVAVLISASAWLAIEAESDPEPLTTTEHLPRDARFWFYWYPGVGQMVETPVQPNLDNCGR